MIWSTLAVFSLLCNWITSLNALCTNFSFSFVAITLFCTVFNTRDSNLFSGDFDLDLEVAENIFSFVLFI